MKETPDARMAMISELPASFDVKRMTATQEENHIKFSDVAGLKEEKEEIAEIVDFLRDPGKYTRLGARISKPVIRGLGFNRVVVVNDGVRQEGQQWGDEHGIEIDPASVHSVEILKGPASLMYGSDA